MKANVIINPVEVRNHLAPFGITAEEFQEVVYAAVGARRGCTENDPPAAPGWMSWCFGLRGLGEVGGRHGYVRDEANNISSIYDEKRGIKIAFCNTDDGTGRADRHPTQRSRKGPATDRIVDANEATLFDYFGIPDDFAKKVVSMPNAGRHNGAPVYWYLCVYCEGEDVRAELSCPTECDAGFFAEFHERIILIAGPDDDGGAKARVTEPDDDSGFEINVVRKQVS